MATQDSVMGLFMSPEMYQQQQNQNALASFAKQAQMDPLERAAMGAMYGGYQLGNVAAGALGGQDPMLKMQSMRNQVMQGVDQNDYTSLAEAAQKLNQSGDTQGARALAQAAQEMQFKQSQITKNLREGNAAMLTTDQRNFKQAQDEGYKGTFNDWIMQKAEKGAQKSVTNINNLQESGLTTSNIKAFGELRDKALTAGSTLETIGNIFPLIDRSFTGLGSDTKLKAAQLADFFGVPISGTSESEQLKSLQTQLKLGNAASLKGNFSDRDMQIVAEGIGQGVTAAGLKGIMRNIQKDALITQQSYNDAFNATQTGKIKDYNFAEASNTARKTVNEKMQRLAELEAKAKGGK